MRPDILPPTDQFRPANSPYDKMPVDHLPDQVWAHNPHLVEAPDPGGVPDPGGTPDIDVFVTNFGQPNQTLANGGDGTFTASDAPGVAQDSLGVALGDLDGDGDLDAFVTNLGGSNQILRNNGDGTFTATDAPGDFQYSVDIALGDLDGDGALELAASAQGAVIWLDPFDGGSVYDQWQERLLIDDTPEENPNPALTDPNVDPDEAVVNTTLINHVRVIDLDGDGRLDVLSTLDRQGQSGLTNDAIVWFRNNGL